MNELNMLAGALSHFADLDEEAFRLSLPFWKINVYKKGDYFNRHKTVCQYLGFIVEGIFRSYVIDEKTGEEQNIFFYQQQSFVVTFKSFIEQVPCDYHTKAMTDSSVVCIGIEDLLSLYKKSHSWERFGRLLAQGAFTVAIERAEVLLFKSAEERYRELSENFPDILNTIPLYHISSYLGIKGPSLSRIRKRISGK